MHTYFIMMSLVPWVRLKKIHFFIFSLSLFRGKSLAVNDIVKKKERNQNWQHFCISQERKGNDYRKQRASTLWLSSKSPSIHSLLIHSRSLKFTTLLQVCKKFLMKSILKPQFILVFRPYITWKILSLVKIYWWIFFFFFWCVLYKGNGI